MFTIQNEQLSVKILDPVPDRTRLGSRYCTGGYIWQICDLKWGPLLSGPQYPDPNPARFDGQGAPEVFETALGQDCAAVNEEVLVIGVGRILRTSPVTPFHVRDNPEVVEFCTWKTERNEKAVIMETSQNYKDLSIHLVRTVSLNHRCVNSRSVLINTCNKPVPLRWFAHPFFPLNRDLVCCKFSRPVRVPLNPGYFCDKSGYLAMRSGYTWKKGLFCPLQMDWGEPLAVTQRHPLVTELKIEVSFPVSRLPVWANANTFSFEPFLDAMLGSGEKKEWFIGYGF